MWSFGGLGLGVLLGFVLHRSDFCMHSALREVLARRPARSFRAYLVALGVQLALVNGLAGLHLLFVPIPPVQTVAAALGGLLFGVGMVYAKG
jgi:uncharacterized protein